MLLESITAGILLAVKLLVASGTIAVVIAALLHWEQIINWVKSRAHLVKACLTNIAFSLNHKLKNGDYETVYGIYNKNTSKLLDAEIVQSKQIDTQLKNTHSQHELAIYE